MGRPPESSSSYGRDFWCQTEMCPLPPNDVVVVVCGPIVEEDGGDGGALASLSADASSSSALLRELWALCVCVRERAYTYSTGWDEI